MIFSQTSENLVLHLFILFFYINNLSLSAQVRGRRVVGSGPETAATTNAGSMYDNHYDPYGQPQGQQPPPQLFDDTSSQNYGYGNQGEGGRQV